MEVDVGSPSPSGGGAVAGDGSHAGFYAGPSSASASSQQPRPGSARKRRRSLNAFTTDIVDPAARSSIDQSDAYFLLRDHSDDEDGIPAKRRNMTAATASLRRQEHSFRALGQAHAQNSYDSTVEDYEYEAVAAASDNGVDSPMHSLSLVSPSTSTIGTFADLYTQPTASNDDDDEDLEMGLTDPHEKPSPPSRQRNNRIHAPMIPRQLRTTSAQLANTPVKHSPLVHGRATLSDEASSSSSTSSSPRPASMDVSSSGTSSPHPLRRSVTTEMVNDLRRMAYTAPPVRTMSQDDMINTPVRRMSRSERAIRTPSPRPQLRPSEDGGDEGGSASELAMRTLHHSPGMNSTPSFPGGKQMLRYTMGYRQDCDLCRNKVAGHYGHVLHRSASTSQ